MRDTNREQIIAYLRNPLDETIQLTDKQKELLQAYVDAYAMMRNYESMPDTIAVLVKVSKLAGKPISAATARRYITDAIDVIGISSEIKKEGIRNLSSEIIRDAIAMAREQKDAKTMILGAEKLAKLWGSDDPEAPNFDLLEPHLYQIMLDPQVMQLFSQFLNRGTVNLDTITGNIMNSMAQDADLSDDSAEN